VGDTDNVVGYPNSKAKDAKGILLAFRIMGSPKSAAVKDINADILKSQISVNIDISKCDIDPSLQRANKFATVS